MSAEEIVARFDRKAADYDSSERRRALAADIVRAVERTWAEDARPRLLDYGAGTGLCTLALAGRCAEVLAVDVSPGMLTRLGEKARAGGIDHLHILRHDLCSAALDGRRFDTILCSMTLHHVEDVDLLLERFHSMLDPGGSLVIAYPEKEDGSFHRDPVGVFHCGFDSDHLVRRMMKAGFTFVSMETVHRIRKTSDSGAREYPVICAVGRSGGV
jgi:tRNA (cmo5U34)-methyltransferase